MMMYYAFSSLCVVYMSKLYEKYCSVYFTSTLLTLLP